MKTDFQRLTTLLSIFQKIKQLSYFSDKTTKRYPPIDGMTEEEITLLKEDLLNFREEIETIVSAWERYKENEK